MNQVWLKWNRIPYLPHDTVALIGSWARAKDSDAATAIRLEAAAAKDMLAAE